MRVSRRTHESNFLLPVALLPLLIGGKLARNLKLGGGNVSWGTMHSPCIIWRKKVHAGREGKVRYVGHLSDIGCRTWKRAAKISTPRGISIKWTHGCGICSFWYSYFLQNLQYAISNVIQRSAKKLFLGCVTLRGKSVNLRKAFWPIQYSQPKKNQQARLSYTS